MACPAGSIADGLGNAHCVQCASGQYSPLEGGTACSECDAVRFAFPELVLDFNMLILCVQGDYQPDSGSSSCMSCPPGSITTAAGQAECVQCEPGEYSMSAGGTDCTECASEEFNMWPAQHTCYPCNDNSDSVPFQRIKCLCDRGYYMLSDHALSQIMTKYVH